MFEYCSGSWANLWMRTDLTQLLKFFRPKMGESCRCFTPTSGRALSVGAGNRQIIVSTAEGGMGAESVQCKATITSSRAIFFLGDMSSSSSSGSRLRLREEVAEDGDWGPGCKRDGGMPRARRRALSGRWKRSRS